MQLFLCEKPSQAKDIARELALSKRGDGYIGDDNIAGKRQRSTVLTLIYW
ncbi:hypothetical protein [Escherichia coli]|nr:hypothetical protein [Escherichia coli]